MGMEDDFLLEDEDDQKNDRVYQKLSASGFER